MTGAATDRRWARIFRDLEDGHAECDRRLAEWCAAYQQRGGKIHCQSGCRECCSLTVNVDVSEAVLLTRALSAAQRRRLLATGERLRKLLPQTRELRSYLRLYRDHLGSCPFLEEDGCCGRYAERPFACRSLLSTRNRDWCGADLTALHPMEVQLFLASLEREVVAYPSHYLAFSQDYCRSAEAGATARCGSEFGLTLTGNLPWLAYLDLVYDLGGRIAAGYEAVDELLTGAGLAHEQAALLRRCG